MRAIDASVKDEDGPGILLMLAREQAAFFYEATKFIPTPARGSPPRSMGSSPA
jgi:hypothetical protein